MTNEKRLVDVEVLEEAKKYIETVEVKIEGEWGVCRKLAELIAADEMPQIYKELRAIIDGPAVIEDKRITESTLYSGGDPLHVAPQPKENSNG